METVRAPLERRLGPVRVYAAVLWHCWGLALEGLVMRVWDPVEYLERGFCVDRYVDASLRIRIGPLNLELGLHVDAPGFPLEGPPE